MSANKTGVKTWLVVIFSLSIFLVSTASSFFVFRYFGQNNNTDTQSLSIQDMLHDPSRISDLLAGEYVFSAYSNGGNVVSWYAADKESYDILSYTLDSSDSTDANEDSSYYIYHQSPDDPRTIAAKNSNNAHAYYFQNGYQNISLEDINNGQKPTSIGLATIIPKESQSYPHPLEDAADLISDKLGQYINYDSFHLTPLIAAGEGLDVPGGYAYLSSSDTFSLFWVEEHPALYFVFGETYTDTSYIDYWPYDLSESEIRALLETDTPNDDGITLLKDSEPQSHSSQAVHDDTPFALLDMSATEIDKEMSSYSQTRFFTDDSLVSHIYCSSDSFCRFLDDNNGNTTDTCGVYAYNHILYWSIMCEGTDRESFTADLRRHQGESFISLGTIDDPSSDTWNVSLEPRDFAEGRTPNVMRLEKVLSASDMSTSALSTIAKAEINYDSLSLSQSDENQYIFEVSKGKHHGHVYFTNLAQGMDGTAPVILMVVVMS